MYRPGELDQKITVIREIRNGDDLGGRIINPAIIYDCISAKARGLTGKEFERFDKLNATEMTLFVIRMRPDIIIDDVIIWNDVRFNIRYIPKKSKREMYSELYAERGVAI